MEPSGFEKGGWVHKKAQVMPSWNPRFIVADPINLRLKYYKEAPKNTETQERGDLKLTDCTVSVDASNNEDEHRFLVTSGDHRKTFHLQVDDEYEMKEWIRIIRLISDLGVIKQKLVEEEKQGDHFGTFKLATETLLQKLDNQATESRKSLDRIAQQKWKAKGRLIELCEEMEEKHRKLRNRQNEMKSQEKSYREELAHLNQALYVLQQQVRRSNELQQTIVEIFGNNTENNDVNMLEKVRLVLETCRNLLANNHQTTNKRLSGSGNQFINVGPVSNLAKQISAPSITNNILNDDNNANKSSNNNDNSNQQSSNEVSSNANANANANTNNANDQNNQNNNLNNTQIDRKKNRARSYSDLTVSKSAIFEDEMIKIIIDIFPQTIVVNTDEKQPESNKNNTSTNNNVNESETEKFKIENSNVIKIFEIYHRYYCEVHLPREMELRKVRTKCEQKYNSLRFVSNQKDLSRREEDEIDWVMMEMKRAIDRLNREGIREAPNEKDNKDNDNDGKNNNNNNNNNNDKKNNKDKKQKEINKKEKQQQEPDHYQPPDLHRDSLTMVPIKSHRSTWSEASDTIFQLNVARHQQYQATKDLEESLKSREVVKSWYEDKISNNDIPIVQQNSISRKNSN